MARTIFSNQFATRFKFNKHISFSRLLLYKANGCICGVMHTVVRNGHNNLCSNPGQGCLHFT